MAAASPDRLSDLPDDLLIKILSFAPSREAASTTALSRRWRRPLWLETGVINFDQRSYKTTTNTTGGGVPLSRHVLEDAKRAHKLFLSRGREPRKLTLVMRHDTTHGKVAKKEADDDDDEAEEEEKAVDEEADTSDLDEDCAAVEAGKCLAGIEELRVEWLDCASPVQCRYTYSPGSLSFAALRVLEITGYLLQPYADGSRRLTFPCLEAMRLGRCRMEVATLQAMIYAAPRLADIRLEALGFIGDQYEYHLHCPAATVIVIADLREFAPKCNFRACHVELDAPRIRRFRYSQVVTFQESDFSFKQHIPPDLEQVHLSVHSSSTRAAQMRLSILTSVRHIRFLMLKAYSLGDLAGSMLFVFYNLERLEIEELCGWCIRENADAASALVNMLHMCPELRELRLKFSWREYLQDTTDPADLDAAMSDFSLCRSIDSANDEENCCDGLDLHILCCGCKIDCLQSSLKRVVVEFDAEELTCFQARLVKFLAKNTVGLEEIIVDGGKGYESSHINRKIARWRKRKGLSSSQLPAKTPIPRWPPPLSEFPLLGRAPGPDSNPAPPCSEVPDSSIACWRPVNIDDLYGEFVPPNRCTHPFPLRFPPRRRPPPASSRHGYTTPPRHTCKTREHR